LFSALQVAQRAFDWPSLITNCVVLEGAAFVLGGNIEFVSEYLKDVEHSMAPLTFFIPERITSHLLSDYG
jgi:hypothetical protein